VVTKSRLLKVFSIISLVGVMTITFTGTHARAAELVMFEQAGCSWCEAFDRDIGTIYSKTDESLRAPLRRLDIALALPSDLSFIVVERLTPLFVLVDKGREIGRIRGYGGPEAFWTQLFTLLEKLDNAGTAGGPMQRSEKTLHLCG
jgi:hypothetical protein